MSGTLNAASFRWDDTRYAASHTLRSYLRSILLHKERNSEFKVRLLANVRIGCAPSGGAFQWVQVPPGNRSSRTILCKVARNSVNRRCPIEGATARRHHPNPAEAHRRWRGERSKPVRLGVRDHHTRSLCAESPAQTEQWCCWLCRRRIIF